MTSKGDDDRSGIEKAKEEAGDALNQTIVTGRKIVIDKETGEIRFEEIGSASKKPAADPDVTTETSSETPLDADAGSSKEGSLADAQKSEEQAPIAAPETGATPEEEDLESTMARPAPLTPEMIAAAEAAAQAKEGAEVETNFAAPPADDDMEKTMAQPGPIIPEELQAKDQSAPAKPAQVGGDMVMTKANKRLSAETLFAFALPEPVINEAIAKAKAEAEGKPTENGEQSPKAQSSKLPLVLGILAVVGGIAAALLYWNLEDSDEVGLASTPQNEALDEAPAVVEQSARQEGRSETAAASQEALPEGSLGADELENLSNEQLLAALSSDDFSLVASAIPVASKRKVPALTKRIIELGSHDDYLIRVNVVRSLSDRSSYTDETADSVLALLLARIDDKDEIVRGFAAKAIGATGDKTALTKLRGRLDQEESEVVTKMIRAALVELESAN